MNNSNTTTTDYVDKFKPFETHMIEYFNHAATKVIKAIERNPNYKGGTLLIDGDKLELMRQYISNEKSILREKMHRTTPDEKVRLDTHKLSSILTLAILKCSPIIDDKKLAHKQANEIVSSYACFIMLLMYRISESTRIKETREFIFENIDYHFIFPKKMHDNYDALSSFIISLRSINYDESPELLYPAKRLIAQIYYYIDDYNKPLIENEILKLKLTNPNLQIDKVWIAKISPLQPQAQTQ